MKNFMNDRGANRLILCLGLLLATVAGPVRADPKTGVRESAFTYFGSADGALNGLLKSETIEPNAGDLCMTTSYAYDPKGNRVSGTTSNCQSPAPSQMAQFASRTNQSDFSSTAARSQTLTIGSGSGNTSQTTVTQVAGLFAISATNAVGQQELRQYDSRFGAAIRLEGPNQLVTTWEVDDFGRKVKELRADGTYTLTWYCVVGTDLDTTSNTTHPGANNTTLECPVAGSAGQPDAAASLMQTQSYGNDGKPAGPFVRVYSDRLGREIRAVTQSFDGSAQPGSETDYKGALVVTDTEYNSYGAKIVQTQPYFLATKSSTLTGSDDRGMVSTKYDALGRAIAVNTADPIGSNPAAEFGSFGSRRAAVQTMEYTGLVTTQTNDLGQRRTEEKNINGQTVRITDASGAQLAHQYDAYGNLVKTKDALQNVISIEYDKRGRKTIMTDPDAGTTRYKYDALGQLKSQQTAIQFTAGTETTMDYDQLGRMTKRTEPEYVSTWSYDRYFADAAGTSTCNKGTGKLCESNTTKGVNRKIVYDSLGRPSTSTTTLGSEIAGTVTTMVSALSYQATTGRVDTQTYPTGVKVGFAYTTLGFLEKVLAKTTVSITPLPNRPPQSGSTPPTANPRTINVDEALWQAKAVNAWGRAEKQGVISGVESRVAFEPTTGRTSELTAGQGSASDVVSQKYGWDSIGNLQQRTDLIGSGQGFDVTESFTYIEDGHDLKTSLNRLTRYQVSSSGIPGSSRTVDLWYNALGMLLYKSDVGNYAYPTQGPLSAQPHALQRVTSVPCTDDQIFTYDANGNVKTVSSGKYRDITYTSFNLPDDANGLKGPGGLPKYTWFYDESHARVVERQQTAAGVRTTIYLHPDNQGGLGFERETDATGAVSNRHYLSAGGQAIGVLVTTGILQPTALSSVTAVKLEYWHKDHLGSLIATSDHWGAVTARYAYDPFGKRRNINGSYDEFGNIVIDWDSHYSSGTDRGYTGHEHLDDVGVIHMNGRIFDPRLGVFLQPDPFIQAMAEMQGYNRYGYCLNSPLTCTDPSGFLSLFGHKILPGLFNNRNLRLAVAIVVAWYLGPASAANGGWSLALTDSVVANTAIAGFASGAIMSGSFQGGINGAFSALVFLGVGDYINGEGMFAGNGAVSGGEYGATAIALHGVAGCVTSVAAGSKCGAGFLSAAFSQASLEYKEGFGKAIGNPLVAGVVSSAVIGGTASVLGGGKFSNGAQTAAFGYLFNWLSHIHRSVTEEGAIAVGMSGEAARNLAELVVNVDKLNDNGTLGSVLNADSQRPDHAYMHSMCEAGSSAATCVAATAEFIEKSFAMKSMEGLALVLHAEQDYLSPGHRMDQYAGSVGPSHIVGDANPGALRPVLVTNTSATIIEYNTKCGECIFKR